MPSGNVIREEKDRADDAWEKRREMMSEKRFNVECGQDNGCGGCDWWITDNGDPMSDSETADLLNRQAEQLEVLREWIRERASDIEFERQWELAGYNFENDKESQRRLENRKDVARTRIAALEGKSP